MVTSPLGQMTGVPAAQSTMSQPSVPASAAGQWTTQAAPAAQLVWHGDAAQVKEQVLPASQTHCPSAHVPEQLLFGSQVTWQGGALQEKSHELPLPQVQVPLAHTAWQLPLSPAQVTWQGGAVQTNRQSSPGGQEQVPFLQPPVTGPQAAASTRARATKKTPPTRMATPERGHYATAFRLPALPAFGAVPDDCASRRPQPSAISESISVFSETPSAVAS